MCIRDSVNDLRRQPQLAHDGQRLYGERLVQLDQIEVIHGQPGAGQHLARRRHRAKPHRARVDTGGAQGVGPVSYTHLNFEWIDPACRSAADARVAGEAEGRFNRWFLDPLYGRHYPADAVAGFAPALPNGLEFVLPGDLDAIATPTDFLGVNYYSRRVARDEEAADNLPQEILADRPRTEMGWEEYPEGLYGLLNWLHFGYRPPKIYVTENGASFGNGPDAAGRVADTRRLNYLRDHFSAARQAMNNGVPLAGYFVWSLMDNFEWAEGYSQRFGICLLYTS